MNTANWRAEAYVALGILPDVFDPAWNSYLGGMSKSAGAVERRHSLWWYMRHGPWGYSPSYPDIAAATTGAGHSTIIKGVRKHGQRMLAYRTKCGPKPFGFDVCLPFWIRHFARKDAA